MGKRRERGVKGDSAGWGNVKEVASQPEEFGLLLLSGKGHWQFTTKGQHRKTTMTTVSQ